LPKLRKAEFLVEFPLANGPRRGLNLAGTVSVIDTNHEHGFSLSRCEGRSTVDGKSEIHFQSGIGRATRGRENGDYVAGDCHTTIDH
jgi:hypothetical protein